MPENHCTAGNSIDDKNRTLIFTYGTLKHGFPNHPLMQDLIDTNDAVAIGAYTTIEELPLVIGPYGVPYLINLPGSGHRVIGELYALSDAGLVRADELEGTTAGHYERLPIVVRANCVGEGEGVTVKAEAYYANRSYAEEMWKKKGKQGLREYTLEDAKAYVSRENRSNDRSSLDEIRLWLARRCLIEATCLDALNAAALYGGTLGNREWLPTSSRVLMINLIWLYKLYIPPKAYNLHYDKCECDEQAFNVQFNKIANIPEGQF